MSERLRVLLLFGGRSAEHDVSRVKRSRHCGRARSEQVRGRPGGDHHRGPLVARRGGTRARSKVRATRCPTRSAWKASRSPRSPTRDRGARSLGCRRAAAHWFARVRRCVAASARSLRRRRHGARLVRVGRGAVRGFRRGGFRRRHGQGDDEARVRSRRVADRGALGVPRWRRSRRVRCRVADELEVPVLRQAGEHGLLDRGHRRPATRPTSKLRSTPHSRSTSGSSSKRPSSLGRLSWACSVTKTRGIDPR